MKYLILILILLAPISAFAVTGENARFDWSLGEPTIADDATSACNNTAVGRFDWSLGQPTVVFDATATCTAAAGGSGDLTAPPVHLHIQNSELKIQNSIMTIQN